MWSVIPKTSSCHSTPDLNPGSLSISGAPCPALPASHLGCNAGKTTIPLGMKRRGKGMKLVPQPKGQPPASDGKVRAPKLVLDIILNLCQNTPAVKAAAPLDSPS